MHKNTIMSQSDWNTYNSERSSTMYGDNYMFIDHDGAFMVIASNIVSIFRLFVCCKMYFVNEWLSVALNACHAGAFFAPKNTAVAALVTVEKLLEINILLLKLLK